MNRITSLLTLCTLLALVSCSEDPVAYTGSGQIQKLIPYSVGDSWAMQEVDRDERGVTTDIDTATTTVDSAGTFIGHSGFFVTEFFHHTGKSWNRFHYYDIDDAKITSVPEQQGVAYAFFRYPAPVNQEMIIFDKTAPNGEYSKIAAKLISENTNVTVPAGRFSCIVYETYVVWGKGNALDTISKNKYYYSNGVGLVQREDFSATISGTLYLEHYSRLIGYNVR